MKISSEYIMSDNEKEKSDAGSGKNGWIITNGCIFPLQLEREVIERLWLVLSMQPESILYSM